MDTTFSISNQIPLPTDLQQDGFAHLFHVNLAKHPEEWANVGKTCTFVNPRWPAEQGLHTIGGLQFDYQGNLCYRVYSQEYNDNFGRCAGISEVHIVEPQGDGNAQEM
jgi:hypothetical protein